jgi:hypothetical protein
VKIVRAILGKSRFFTAGWLANSILMTKRKKIHTACMAMICQRRFNDKAEEMPYCPHNQDSPDSQGVSGLFVPVIPREGRVTLVSSCLMPQDAE